MISEDLAKRPLSVAFRLNVRRAYVDIVKSLMKKGAKFHNNVFKNISNIYKVLDTTFTTPDKISHHIKLEPTIYGIVNTFIDGKKFEVKIDDFKSLHDFSDFIWQKVKQSKGYNRGESLSDKINQILKEINNKNNIKIRYNEKTKVFRVNFLYATTSEALKYSSYSVLHLLTQLLGDKSKITQKLLSDLRKRVYCASCWSALVVNKKKIIEDLKDLLELMYKKNIVLEPPYGHDIAMRAATRNVIVNIGRLTEKNISLSEEKRKIIFSFIKEINSNIEQFEKFILDAIAPRKKKLLKNIFKNRT